MYYSGMYNCSFPQFVPSNWHQHFKGIFARCTLPIILFLAGIDVMVECTLASSACKFVPTGYVALPLVKRYVDYLNLMSWSVSGVQNLLDISVKALSWAGMYFRAGKSYRLIIVKGKCMNTTLFYGHRTINSVRFAIVKTTMKFSFCTTKRLQTYPCMITKLSYLMKMSEINSSSNRFEHLFINNEDSVQAPYDKLEKVLNKTASKSLARKEKEAKKPWVSTKSSDFIEQRQSAWKRY